MFWIARLACLKLSVPPSRADCDRCPSAPPLSRMPIWRWLCAAPSVQLPRGGPGRTGIFLEDKLARVLDLDARDAELLEFLPKVLDGLGRRIERDEQMGEFSEILGGDRSGERKSADPPFVHRVDDAGDHRHLLGVDFEVAVTQKQEVVLEPERHGLIVRQRVDDRQHRLDRLVQRRVRAAVNAGGLDQRVQLGDELEAQHHHLLVEDVPGFRSLRDLVREISRGSGTAAVDRSRLARRQVWDRSRRNAPHEAAAIGGLPRCLLMWASAMVQACRTVVAPFF